MNGHTRRFENKVAVVTASTAGIGLSIAERLGLEGAEVVVCSRRQANVEAAVKALQAKGIKCGGMACHVGKASDVAALLKHVMEAHGRVDVLVSNAAANPEAEPVLSISDRAIDKLLEVNVKAAVSLVQAFAPLIPSGGSVLLVSSVTAFAPAAPVAMYAVSKTALLGLTKALAAELGSRSVRVNCLCPGIVPTKLSEALIADAGDRARLEQSTCLGRLGRPEEVAACAAFLCSDDASYVTGENLVVSGGMQSRL